MKTNLIVLLLLGIVPLTASSQVTLTPTQADNLVRLINDYESLKERHAIVIGRLTEAEEIIWKYGDLINECDKLNQQCEAELNYTIKKITHLENDNSDLKKKVLRNRVISVVSVGVAVLALLIT